ncbi:MAG: methyltransferase domain-containing protein [Fibrobacteria bacterium]|nr:methyltransferase domain-containing protein [Fibrobacteria bacterium]
MQYDFYNQNNLYKPALAVKARERLHTILFKGISFSSVLEVGIGFCELADYCRKKGIEWIGIDANEQLLEQARNKGYTVYQAMMPAFPEVNEKCEAIFASHFIEHLKDYQEALEFITKSKELLKKKNGKYLILLYPDIEKIGHFFWQDYTHSFVTNKKRIEDMLYDTGFELVKSGRYTSCFFSTSGLISFIGKLFPYFLLPKKIAMFAKLSFQQHSYTIGKITMNKPAT